MEFAKRDESGRAASSLAKASSLVGQDAGDDQDAIKRNRAHIHQLTLDNLFERDANANDQKILTKMQV